MIKKSITYFGMLLGLLATSEKSKSQNLSNKGREFWCGYGHHQYMEQPCPGGGGEGGNNTQNLVLYFSTEDQAARVKVFIGGRLWYDSTISANTVVSTRNLPKSGALDARLFTTDCSFTLNPTTHPNCDGEGIFKDTTILNPIGSPSNFFRPSIQILSDVPIVAYEHIYGSVSSGATMLLPIETWGYKYYTINSKQGDDPGLSNCYSWFYVIAKHNNTRIRITSAQNTRRSNLSRNFLTGENRPYGIKDVPYEIVLDEGEVYQAMGAPECTPIKPEMTGTLIESIPNPDGSCFPIAVFSGSSRTGNNQSPSCTSGGRDNDNQQCFPTQAWGKKYILAPLANTRFNNPPGTTNMINTYKIAVMDPTTVLERMVNGVWQVVPRNGPTGPTAPLSGLINNRYYFMESDQVEQIRADKPIMVAQFMTGGQCMRGGQGDPEMIYLSPVEQGINKIAFYRNSREQIRENYLVLNIPENGLNSLRIDGLLNNWTNAYSHVNAPGRKIVVKHWTIGGGQGLQSTASSDSSFNAVTYGLGGAESYGYNAGTLINNLGAIGSVYNSEDTTLGIIQHPYACDKSPTQLSVLLAYDSLPTRMIWRISQVLGGITPNVDVTVGNGVADIIPEDTVYVNGARYYKFVLPGLYQFNDTGTFVIPITVKNDLFDNQCREGLVYSNITVKSRPRISFISNPSLNYISCITDSVNFYAPARAYNNSRILLYKWSFPAGSASTINFTNDTVKQKFIQAGTHNITLRVVNDNGCVGDTTLPITIAPKPIAKFVPTQDTSVCIGTTITLTDNATSQPNWSTYTGGGSLDSIYWKVGDSGFYKNDRNDFSLLLDSAGLYSIKHVVGLGIDSSACMSDTASIAIRVWNKPSVSFTFPPCVGASGQITLSDASTTTDGQTINPTSHIWGVNPGGLNSTQINPTFTLSAGSYTISHTVTTENGCTNRLDSTTNVYLYPSMQFAASNITDICENATSVRLTASISNGVSALVIPNRTNPWYSGPGVDSTGLFNPANIGYGPKKIWFHVIGAGGCEDSISYDVNVHPKPLASFRLSDPTICDNVNAIITNLSSIPAGYTINQYEWNYGDGITNNFTNTTQPNVISHDYTVFGDYTISLKTTSDKGCTDDTTMTIRVNAKPVASFFLPGRICIGDTVKFTNESTTADGLNMTYQWNFGDPGNPPNTSIALNGQHRYIIINSYNVKLTTTTNAGCADDTTISYDRFSDKPVARFEAVPEEVCQGTPIQFNDQSTDPTNTPISVWAWNFGNSVLNSSTSPIYTYPKAGRYRVSLKVTNETGCVSDEYRDSVIVYVQPRVDAGPSFVALQGTRIQFQPYINDSTRVSFLWTPGTGLLPNATSIRPSLIVTQDQRYLLTVTADGPLDCSDTDSLYVKMLLPVKVPNAFSPNGDGINDLWQIENLKEYPTMRIQVMNRYGQNVFRTYGYNKPWDGTMNGKPLPAGTYFYIIELNNGLKPISGSVSIIR